jgi:hypothetical protein
MSGVTLKEIEAEEVVREAQARTIRALVRAKVSWGRAGDLCQRDTDLLSRSRELIARGRQLLNQRSAEAEQSTD